MIRASLILLLAVAATPAFAEIAKEQKSAFSRAKSLLGSSEMRLKTSQKQEAGSAGADKAMQEVEDRLGKALELVKEIPATEPEMVEFKQRVDAVKAEVAKRRGAAGQAKAEAVAESADLEKGTEADLPTMEALRQRLPELRSYLGDNLKIEGLELWPRLRDDADALVKKYDGKRGQSAAAKKMEEQTERLKSELGDARRWVKDHLKSLPSTIQQYIDQADKGTQPGSEDGNIEAFVGKMSYAHRAAVLLDKFELLAKAEAGTDTSFVAAARARIEAIEKRIEGAKVKVVAKAPVPPELYAGADKDKLRATIKEAWLTTNPKYPVAKIVMGEKDWTRRTEWVWDRDRWRKVDLSTLQGWVFVKADDKTANYYACYLIRDHANGERLTVKVGPSNGKPANWNQVVLLSRL